MTDSKKTTGASKKTAAAGSTSKTATRKAPTKKAAAPKKPAASNSQQVNIDGKTYDLNTLSDNAKTQVNNLRATDRLINELELELSIARTARSSYSENLERELSAMNTTLQ